MRVLVVHNHYRSEMPSGENEVVVAEVDLLRAAGVDVDVYFRSSDEIEAFGAFERATLPVRAVYSFEDARRLREQIRETRPDVLHLHNPYPLISPAVVRVAKSEGVPVVQTVHNYRHSCPNGLFFRDGAACEDCSGKATPWPAVLHGCYRGSRPQSAVMVAAARAHRGTWQMVDRYVALSEFVAGHLVKSGIPRERIVVRPNFTKPCGQVKPLGSGFLFVGRLTAEKGISLLMSAWDRSRVWETQRLVVVGDGPERDLVRAATDRNIEFVGGVDHSRVPALLDASAIVVVPSLFYEGFPRLVAETFERGRPVAATGIGSLAEMIDSSVGWKSAPDPAAFAEMLTVAATDPTIHAKGAAARAVFESRLAPEVATAALIDLYNTLQSERP